METLDMPELPKAVEVNFDNIPPELQLDQCVVWKYEIVDREVKKPPYSPKTGKRASIASPNTWGSFQDARGAYETGQWDGIGIVLFPTARENGKRLVVIDIDDCIEKGQISDDALHIISTLNSYTELSPSIPQGETGPTGIHIWMKGQIPGSFRKNEKRKVEIYEDRRYMTLTGHPLHGENIPFSQDQTRLNAIYHEIFVYDDLKENTGGGQARTAPRYFAYVSDERAIERGLTARNGYNFKRHYEGDESLWEGPGSKYTSQSSADFVLCLFLLRVTNRDTVQTDRLFRRSGLIRAKWDRIVKWDYQKKKPITYGEYTIRKALNKAYNN